jgi:hypothetical protein
MITIDEALIIALLDGTISLRTYIYFKITYDKIILKLFSKN